jgi:hypothetical protein
MDHMNHLGRTMLHELLPTAARRREYLKMVANLPNTRRFFDEALTLLEGDFLGRFLTKTEREHLGAYLRVIWSE